MDCTLCTIGSKPKTKSLLYENDWLYVMLDDDWAVLGHSLVVWKKHVVNISDLSDAEWGTFSQKVREVESVLLSELNKEKSVILKSGGLLKHLHFHIYPFSQDVPWQDVKDAFDKKSHVDMSLSDKEKLREKLRSKLMNL